MVSISFSGKTLREIAKEANQFANLILNSNSPEEYLNEEVEEEINERLPTDSSEGYRPEGVGDPGECRPVDNGQEWTEAALRDWISRLQSYGKTVVKILAEQKIIDPRKEADNLQWTGIQWAGTWTGPRRQARNIMAMRNLKSWPYGHSYEEPRKLWMHEVIANRVLSILKNEGFKEK